MEYSRLASADDALLRADGDALAAEGAFSVLHRPPEIVDGEPPATLCRRHRRHESANRPTPVAARRAGGDNHGRERPGRWRAPVAAAGGRDLGRDACAEGLGPVGVDEVRRGARAERGQPGAAQVAVVPVLEAGLQLGGQFLGRTKQAENQSA